MFHYWVVQMDSLKIWGGTSRECSLAFMGSKIVFALLRAVAIYLYVAPSANIINVLYRIKLFERFKG